MADKDPSEEETTAAEAQAEKDAESDPKTLDDVVPGEPREEVSLEDLAEAEEAGQE